MKNYSFFIISLFSFGGVLTFFVLSKYGWFKQVVWRIILDNVCSPSRQLSKKKDHYVTGDELPIQKDEKTTIISKGPRRFTIIFASQTGTAESFSRQLGSLLTNAKYSTNVADIEDIEPDHLIAISKEDGHWVVFFTATYGEGEPTDSAKRLYKWLGNKKKRDRDCLFGLKYAIMGLGNSQYTQFNEAARRLDCYLKRLGGVSVCRRGEGDDDGDIEGDFSEWLRNEFEPLLNIQSEAKKGDTLKIHWKEIERTCLAVGATIVKDEESLCNVVNIKDTTQVSPVAVAASFYFNCHKVPVKEVVELRQQSNEMEGLSSKHITFDVTSAVPFTLSPHHSITKKEYSDDILCGVERMSHWKATEGQHLPYDTGNTLELLPRQCDDLVKRVFERLTLTQDGTQCTSILIHDFINFFHVSQSVSNKKWPFPPNCSIRQILQYFCDLSGCPSRELLRDFGVFLRDDHEKRILSQITDAAAADKYKQLIKDQMLNLIDCFDLFFTSSVFCNTHEDFIAALLLLPRVASRPYTISSSSVETPNSISITVTEVRETKKLNSIKYCSDELNSLLGLGGFRRNKVPTDDISCNASRQFRGLCSQHICGKLTVGRGKESKDCHALIKVVKSAFTFPDLTKPIIMIGTGTGIAPFRGFWRQIAHLSSQLHTTREKPLEKNDMNHRELFGLPPASILFYGCTSSNVDFLYKKEIEEFSKASQHSHHPVISHLFVAFSRDQQKKLYVQDLVYQQKVLIKNELKDGCIYICGSIKMGLAVRGVLRLILGENKLNNMIKNRKFIEEVWSSD